MIFYTPYYSAIAYKFLLLLVYLDHVGEVVFFSLHSLLILAVSAKLSNDLATIEIMIITNFINLMLTATASRLLNGILD